MRGPKHMAKLPSLREAIDLCLSLFVECRNIPSLAEDGRISSRELEFRRLLSYSNDHEPLTCYVEHHQEDGEAIFSYLRGIEGTLKACLRISNNAQNNGSLTKHEASLLDSDRHSDQDSSSNASITSDETSTTEDAMDPGYVADYRLRQQKACLNVYLDSLTKHLGRIRDHTPGMRPQFYDADQFYDESQHKELWRHLTTLVLLQPYEFSLLNRLRGMGLIGVEIVIRAWLTDITRLNTVQARLIDGVMRRRHRITFATKHAPTGSASSRDESQLTPGMSLEVPQSLNQKGSGTHDGNISSARNPNRLQSQSRNIPVPTISTGPSTSHVAGDLQPYTCILEDCKTPIDFFLTTSDWLRHMNKEHKSWLFYQATGRVYQEVDGCQYLKNQAWRILSPMRCPLCNYRSSSLDIELDDHIPEHIHSFSLRALPWNNESLFASSQIDSSVNEEKSTDGMSMNAGDFQPPPTTKLNVPPFPQDSRNFGHNNWTLDVRSYTEDSRATWKQRFISLASCRKQRQTQNLIAAKNTFILIHDHSISPRHWRAVENFVSKHVLNKGVPPNQIRLYFTSEPERVNAFNMSRGRRRSAAAKDVAMRLRVHGQTIRSRHPFSVAQIPNQSTLLPKSNNTKVNDWIDSTPLGLTFGVAATLDAMNHICNDIKGYQAEETSSNKIQTKEAPATVWILTSQDGPINIWTSAFHKLVGLINERTNRSNHAPIHTAFIMIGDRAQCDDTAVLDLWTDVLRSSISSSISDESITSQENPGGHIVQMSGRVPGLGRPTPATTAAEPSDRAKTMAVLESFPSYRLRWTRLRECLELLFPSHYIRDPCEIERERRYYFSVPRPLLSVEKDYIWRLAHHRRSLWHDQTGARDMPIRSSNKVRPIADVPSEKKKHFLLATHLNIAAPPDGPLHLGSIVTDTARFEPLGAGETLADLPSRTSTTTQQDVKMRISSPRVDGYLDLYAKQLDKTSFEPLYEDVLAVRTDPVVEEFCQRRARIVPPFLYMITGLMVAKDGQTVKVTPQQTKREEKGVVVEEGAKAGLTIREEKVVRVWDGGLVVGIRAHRIVWKENNTEMREFVFGVTL
ncbi:hypothetical protein F5Y10DRAFT_264287 [Nemania abortiva]|nr:hypothetical protein F5Y10DRAFT_264287 [Nemania abortiva]